MKIFSLLNTQYTAYTTSIRNYLADLFSKYNMTYGNSTIFGQIINVIGATVQNIMLYIEDALVEQNKYTAQRKKSIYGLAAVSGYEPSLGKSTGVQLCLSYTPTNVQNFNIIINNKQKLVCTQNGLFYNLILPQESIIMSIDKDNSSKYLYAVQGKFETQSFISTGGKYYTQNFKYLGYLDVDYLEVSVNNEKWEKVDSIYDMTPNSKQFTLKNNFVGGVDVIFGNDVHGMSLKNNDIINITYLIHDGEQGNLDSNKETFFIFNDDLIDTSGNYVDGNNIFKVTFASNDAVTSGSNSEDIEQVRQMIGLNSRSLVLATADNYKRFIGQFSFCGYSRTWDEPGSLIVNSIIMKNYKLQLNEGKDYFNLSESDFLLTDNQKQSLLNSIESSGNQLAGVTYNIFDPEICKYALYLYITMKNVSYDKEYIINNIKNLIGDFFSNIQNDMYIPKSDIINLLKTNISAIDGVNVYFLSEKNEKALQTKSYVNKIFKYNPATGTYDKSEETIYLYDGENPNLGLDVHGNILLTNDEQFPALLGGWDYLNKEGQEVYISDPLTIAIN